MNRAKKQQESDFNKTYSRFKVMIFYKNRNPITHYGQERYHCTAAQVYGGYVKLVTLDRERGLKDCIDRIALCDQLYGMHTTAIIYDMRAKEKMRDGTEMIGKQIMKYIAGQLVEWTEIIFQENENRILCEVLIRNGHRFLKPIIKPSASVPDGIDFKTEINNALYKNNNTGTSD